MALDTLCFRKQNFNKILSSFPKYCSHILFTLEGFVKSIDGDIIIWKQISIFFNIRLIAVVLKIYISDSMWNNLMPIKIRDFIHQILRSNARRTQVKDLYRSYCTPFTNALINSLYCNFKCVQNLVSFGRLFARFFQVHCRRTTVARRPLHVLPVTVWSHRFCWGLPTVAFMLDTYTKLRCSPAVFSANTSVLYSPPLITGQYPFLLLSRCVIRRCFDSLTLAPH